MLINSGYDIQKSVRDALLADNAIQALVGNRIYEAAPSNPAVPYIIIGDMNSEPPELTSTSILARYSMEVSAVVGPDLQANSQAVGFKNAHAILDRVTQLMQDRTPFSWDATRKVLRVYTGAIKTERAEEYRIISLPVEVWVWQAR